MNKDTSDIRIYLVAEATAKSPTGYHATFHEPSRVTPFSIDDIDLEDFAVPVLSEDILLVRKNSSESGVTNMVASYLSGENFYTDVAFLAFDQKTRLLSLPTFAQLKLLLDILCLKVDLSAPGNVAFSNMDKTDAQKELPTAAISKTEPQTLALFEDLFAVPES